MIADLVVIAVFGALTFGAVQLVRRVTTSTNLLDQSDPFVLEAVREVDAEFPALPPLLDPKIRAADEAKLAELAMREKSRQEETARTLAAERAFFERKQRVPIWNRPDVEGYVQDGPVLMIVMKDGRRVAPEAVALYGWDAALTRLRNGSS